MGKRWPIMTILAAYLALALGYGIVNPLFEGPDEHHHYFTSEWIAQNWRLPSVPQPVEPRGFIVESVADEAGYLGQEAAQPPLYYIATAPLVALFDTSQSKELTIFNKFAALGDASVPANKNGFAHGPWEQWPGRGHVTAIYLLRAISALIGAGTIWLIYATARQLWPEVPVVALWAAGLVGLLPQFTFQHSLVSNDVLITLWVTLALHLLVRIYINQSERDLLKINHSSTQRRKETEGKKEERTIYSQQSATDHQPRITDLPVYLTLGAVIGLAILTKNQGTVLLLYGIGFLIVIAIQKWLTDPQSHQATLAHRLSPTIFRLLSITLPALLIGGWLWIRNLRLYGDWSAANQFVVLAGGDREATLRQVFSETPGLWRSFIAVFGWMTVAAPNWLYWVWGTVLGIAFFGLLGGAYLYVRRSGIALKNRDSLSLLNLLKAVLGDRPLSLGLLLFGWVVAVYAALVLFMLQTEAAQGRLLFPALLPLALGTGWGLTQLLWSIKWRGLIAWVTLVILFGLNLYALFGVLGPAFQRPTQVVREEGALVAVWPNGLTLTKHGQPTAIAIPGEWIDVPLTWVMANEISSADRPELVLELFGIENQLLGKWQGYHGRGLYPADLWPRYQTNLDTAYLQIFEEKEQEEALNLPVEGRLLVKPSGAEFAAEVGRVKVAPTIWPAFEAETLAQLAPGFDLVSASVDKTVGRPGGTITIDLVWQVNEDQSEDFTTRMHLGTPGQTPLATGDSQPRAGFYPTTLWRSGERFTDRYTLILPDVPGRYQLLFGMYITGSPTFEAVSITSDQQQPDKNTLILGEVEVK